MGIIVYFVFDKTRKTRLLNDGARFLSFWTDLGWILGPLDFDVGPNIVHKCLRRGFFGILRSPRALFVHFQVNIKSKTTFDRC